MIARRRQVVFSGAYGLAGREQHIANRLELRKLTDYVALYGTRAPGSIPAHDSNTAIADSFCWAF
jgi:hypothetical protein